MTTEPPQPSLSSLFEHRRCLRGQIRFRELLSDPKWFQSQLDDCHRLIEKALEQIQRLQAYHSQREIDKHRLQEELRSCEEKIPAARQAHAREHLHNHNHHQSGSTTHTRKISPLEQSISDLAALLQIPLDQARAIVTLQTK